MRLPGFLCFLLFSSLLWAEPKWIRINSEHFELISTGGEGSARDLLKYFEQVRGFFVQALGQMKGSEAPVTIVMFNSAKDYDPFKISETAAAFYHSGGERDYIVLGPTGDERHETAVHEFVHLLVRHAGIEFPPWLNEGIADLYSTLKPQGDKIMVGTPVSGRVYQIANENWAPLEAIVSADLRSEYYNDKNKVGSLYSEGWLLTHMLMLSDGYREKFLQFVSALKQEGSKPALESVYGRPLSKIEQDMRYYMQQNTIKVAVFPVRFQKNVGPLNAEPLPPFDAKLRLVGLLSGPKQAAQAAKMYAELFAEQPKRPEPHILKGYHVWREGRRDEAVSEFRQAVELGGRDPHMLWDYGRLIEEPNPSESQKLFGKLLEDAPARLDVRLELARLQIYAHQGALAELTLTAVKKVTPGEAPKFFRLLMLANLEVDKREDAKASAEKVIQYSKDAKEVAEARRVIDYIDKKITTAPEIQATGDAPPRMERHDAGTVAADPPPAWPSVTGQFLELNCNGDKAMIVLEVKGEKRNFLIDEPNRVTILNGKPGAISMTCGKQKPVELRIEYAPATADNGPNVSGLVRVLQFGD